MSRLKDRFGELQSVSRKALIPYITAGYPAISDTVRFLHALVRGGADVLEVGVPFSDPMADGPVIQSACERALAQGTSLRDTLAAVRQFREKDETTPVVLMGYLNPVEAMGYEQLAEDAASAGVDGVLTVDVTVEECDGLLEVLQRRGIAPVFLLSPTTSETRVVNTCSVAEGYLYYVSVKGVTGGGSLDAEDIDHHVRAISRHTELPVVVGFGIRDAQSAARISRVADGVVVGSALVSLIADHADDSKRASQALETRLSEMRTAMDEAAGQDRTETAEGETS